VAGREIPGRRRQRSHARRQDQVHRGLHEQRRPERAVRLQPRPRHVDPERTERGPVRTPGTDACDVPARIDARPSRETMAAGSDIQREGRPALPVAAGRQRHLRARAGTVARRRITSEVIDPHAMRGDHADRTPPRRPTSMPTMEEYAKQPREERMRRLARTPDDLAAAIKGQSDAILSRRPDATNWAAKEVVCHLRDTEEAFGTRFELILAMDVDPALVGSPADRLAEERQYLRNDAEEALAAFRRRRAETLVTFGKLSPAQWDKGGIHPVRGRIALDGFLSLMAWHDDNHLDQLTRALQGRA